MTLLASERSLLIRNKFRSVLQLRIQNRMQNEINADSGLKTTSQSHKGEKDQSEALRLTDDGAAQKSPPTGLKTETAQDRTVCGAQRQKKARHAQDPSERIPRRPGSLEHLHKHTLPLENCPSSFPLSTDVFEDDISSCASSTSELLGDHQSPCFSLSPGLPVDQSLSDMSPLSQRLNHSPSYVQSSLVSLPATEGISQPMSMPVGDSNATVTTGRPKGTYLTSQVTPLLPKTARPPSSPESSLSPSLNSSRPPRPRKPRDAKPKMRKLKYHQYIPPDQKVTAGTAGGVANQKSPAPAQPADPTYSHQLQLQQQQQVFLQLQILQNQQQLTVAPSGDANQMVRFSGATPQNPQPVPAATNPAQVNTSPTHKPELLPPNLVELTVSELRQQLRKRGLPVSGTKPALLQRLRPFQLHHTSLTPAPLTQLGASPDLLPASPVLRQSPSPSSSSGPESPNGSTHQPFCIQPNGIQYSLPNGIPSGVPSGILNSFPNGLPLSGRWLSEQEQQQQQQELSVEREMRDRMRSRPKDRGSTPDESCGASLHPFLQQDPGCLRGQAETDRQTEVIFTQVFCCQPCNVIGQDFELPLQITASPVRTPPSVRSLEEELQEAIQKAQMDLHQSIEDILDEPISSVDVAVNSGSVLQSPAHSLPGPTPPPQMDQSCHPKDDNFLSSPLCSSLLLELPPSPTTPALPQVAPARPPPSICTSPVPPAASTRKRRAPATFDPVDWLESLTAGLPPLSPPAAPFVEVDFGLDSDLNVNKVLGLIEQW
ncbi:uncharacterized protein FYW47_006989 [Aplochiton taeniatus]